MEKFDKIKKEGKGKEHHTGGGRKINLDTQFSKTLSWILRHGAKNMGILEREDGFVPVDKVLAADNLQSFKKKPGNFLSVEKLMEVVEKDEKQRYALETFDDILHIRANQGHSFPVPELQLKPITQTSDIPTGIAFHGTYAERLPQIFESGGLKTMNRTHIHFAIGLPTESGVLSGIRANVDTLIYLNVDKVLQDGIPLFLSANNVVLCPGKADTKMLPIEYIAKIINRKTNEEIPIPK